MAKVKVHAAALQVTAYAGWAIYADYDANAPDSADKLWVSTEELAKEVCAKLNEDPRSYNELAYVEGYEYCKSFQYHEALLKEDNFARTMAQAFEGVEVDGNVLLVIAEPDGEPERLVIGPDDAAMVVSQEGFEWQPGEPCKLDHEPASDGGNGRVFLVGKDGSKPTVTNMGGRPPKVGDFVWADDRVLKVVETWER